MAFDRQGTGLALTRILIGLFFVFEGLGKLQWLVDSSPLAVQLSSWLPAAPFPSRWYLGHVAIPHVSVFARVVMLAELAAGVALVAGFWTRLAALLAFLMVLNFHFASGQLFRYQFLTNGYGLPVLAALVGLVFGGAHLPLSLKK